MKKSLRFITVLAASAAVFIATQAGARSFGSAPSAGANMSDVTKRTACFLFKTSVKGSNGGMFSGDSKSVEATCQDIGGEPFKFSASGNHYQSLVEAAAQMVIVETAPNKGQYKVKDAKTNNILVKISPVSEADFQEDVICGPENPANIQYDEGKAYSVGYRVVRAVQFIKAGKEWRMVAYTGKMDDDKWDTRDKNKVPEVTFSGQCKPAANMTKMLYTDGPIIFDYMQKKEGGKYFIGRAAVIR